MKSFLSFYDDGRWYDLFEAILICERGVVIQMHQELGRRPADFQRFTVNSETRGVGLVRVWRSWVGLYNFVIE